VSAKENTRTEPEGTQTDAVALLYELFRNHPAILGSLIYVLVTAIGIIYSGILYRRFGINIFDFAEMNDLLLAAFKDAFAFAMSLVTIFLGLGFVLLLRRAREGIDRSPLLSLLFKWMTRLLPWIDRSQLLKWTSRLLPIVVIIYAFAPAYIFAHFEANQILHDQEDPVRVAYRANAISAEPKIKQDVELIGTTNKVAFFYDANAERKPTLVIPHAQIVSIKFSKK
jgi:hypothetical protein